MDGWMSAWEDEKVNRWLGGWVRGGWTNGWLDGRSAARTTHHRAQKGGIFSGSNPVMHCPFTSSSPHPLPACYPGPLDQGGSFSGSYLPMNMWYWVHLHKRP